MLFNETKLINCQFGFRSKYCQFGFHKVYTEKINKIALSSNDDRRVQGDDKITTYPYMPIDYFPVNNDDNTVNTENIDDISVSKENTNDNHVNTDDIYVSTENIDIIPVNTENNEGNTEYIEVTDNTNSPYIDYVDDVVYTEIIDTTSTHTKIIDDITSKYGENIDDIPVNAVNIDGIPVNTENIDDISVNNRSKVLIEDVKVIRDKDACDFDKLIENACMLNKRYDSTSKDNNTLLEEASVLIDIYT